MSASVYALADFATRPQWVAWRNEPRGGDLTKVPYYTADRQAEADNPTTWLPHDQAVVVRDAIVNGAGGGVGIELGRCGDDWIVGVDLDTCRDPASGVIEPWAQGVIDRLASYCEVSPSGTGVKLFALINPADVPELRTIMGTEHGRQFKRANGGKHPPAIELYTSNRYFAVTWQPLPGTPAELRTVPLDDWRWLITEAGPAFSGKPERARGDADDGILARLDTAARHNRRIDTALRHAATMHGGSRSEGAMAVGTALKRAGWTFDDVHAALLACPATREWAEEQDERQFRRIWDRADDDGPSPADDPDAEQWPEPLDFIADNELTGTPELRADHLPDAIAPFVFDAAERMGVDPAAVALAALVALASVMPDTWRLQPKQYDTDWTESPRIWGALVGPPSFLKSPIIRLATTPIDKLEIAARQQHASDMQRYKADMKAWKDAGSEPATEPRQPRLDRYMVEDTTIEALSEVLRDDMDARLNAPAGKVLARQDEMSEWLGRFDRYAGGRGSSDRGAYLRLYNGGRYTVDRIGRGSFAASSWSACILGGIQPEPIQRTARDGADDGLLQRFCYAVPARQEQGQDRKPSYAATERYERLFPILAGLHPGQSHSGSHRHAILHADAHTHRLDILKLAGAVGVMPDATPRLRSALDKWPGLFPRLTLVFHLITVADQRANGHQPILDVVQPDTAHRTATYMRDILLPHLLRAEAVMFATQQTGHAKWIAGHILSEHLTRISIRDVVRAYRALQAPEQRRELQEVMFSLETVGWLRSGRSEGPSTRWAVNPRVHDVFAARAQAEHEARADIKRRIADAAAQLRRDGVIA